MTHDNLERFLRKFENASTFAPTYEFFVKLREALTEVNFEISSRHIDSLMQQPSERRPREQIEQALRQTAAKNAEAQAYCLAMSTLHTSMIQHLIHKGVLDEEDRLLHATFLEESFSSLLSNAKLLRKKDTS